jgi:hypothetical protein
MLKREVSCRASKQAVELSTSKITSHELPVCCGIHAAAVRQGQMPRQPRWSGTASAQSTLSGSEWAALTPEH